MVRHALDATEKHARRVVILEAAQRLFIAEPEKLPSAAQIAEAAGLAKGTVYLYFRTKEEIFMALLNEDRISVLALVHRAFAEQGHSATERVEQFLDDYVEHVRAHPHSLQLEAQGYSVLERNMDLERLLAFKRESLGSLLAAGEVIDQAVAAPPGLGCRLLIHTYAISLGLWQALDVPDTCRELLAAPDMAALQLDFHIELRDALARYWRLD